MLRMSGCCAMRENHRFELRLERAATEAVIATGYFSPERWYFYASLLRRQR